MNANTLHSVKKTHRLVIASLMLIATFGIASANTAHASHGHYNDGSALSFSISYGYYPEHMFTMIVIGPCIATAMSTIIDTTLLTRAVMADGDISMAINIIVNHYRGPSPLNR